MAAVEIQGIRKGYGEHPILRGIDLSIADGEFVVFVGPSGCGKSTLLRTICGLEAADEGAVMIGGRDMTHVSPAQRGIAMVFQSYALYPHMTVYDNMGFALKLAGLSSEEIRAKVEQAAATLRIEPLLQRKPKELSGGQRQRVAIGRAIVRQPQVFLFDEPLSNLDAALRVQMRIELKNLHRTLRSTMIYVTHDQVEAMTLADRIVVLRGGRVEQVGAPLDLYQRPANMFVAGFLGSPAMNFVTGVVELSSLSSSSGAMSVRVTGGSLERGGDRGYEEFAYPKPADEYAYAVRNKVMATPAAGRCGRRGGIPPSEPTARAQSGRGRSPRSQAAVRAEWSGGTGTFGART